MVFPVTVSGVLSVFSVLAATVGSTYETVVAEVERNLNLQEFQADLKIEFVRDAGSAKTWTAKLYAWSTGTGGDRIDWKTAKFYGSREAGTVIRKKGGGFSQKNGDMPYFPLGEGAAEVGIFGTDYSFKDILELTRLTSDYDKVTFEDDGKYYHVVMQAKPGKKPFYFKREMWVDKEKLYPVKMQVYGSTGQLLKTMETLKTERFSGANFPVEILVTSGTRKTTTRITLTRLEPVKSSVVQEFMQ